MMSRFELGPAQVLHDHETGHVWVRRYDDWWRVRLIGVVRPGEPPLRVRGVSFAVETKGKA